MSNYYEILNVDRQANTKEIKLAYYRLAKLYHPDKSNSDRDLFVKINEAYNILIDPIKRKDYDRSIYNVENESSDEEEEFTFENCIISLIKTNTLSVDETKELNHINKLKDKNLTQFSKKAYELSTQILLRKLGVKMNNFSLDKTDKVH
jgi:DnaJ-class molecular chaperone